MNVFSFFKKKTPIKLLYKEYINRIEELLYNKKLESIIYSNINKIYIMNLHNESFEDFLDSFFNTNTKIQIYSVSIDKFFKTLYGYVNLYDFLNRIKNILIENKKLKEESLKDLEEILDSFEYLISISGE